MSKSSSGYFHGTAGEKASIAKLRSKVSDAVNKLIAKTPGSKRKAMAVGAYDKRTGKVIAAFAGEVPKRIAPILRERAEMIGVSVLMA